MCTYVIHRKKRERKGMGEVKGKSNIEEEKERGRNGRSEMWRRTRRKRRRWTEGRKGRVIVDRYF